VLVGGNQTVFTDSEGHFFIRLKHDKSVTVQVLTEQFATAQWSVNQTHLETNLIWNTYPVLTSGGSLAPPKTGKNGSVFHWR
jgi:hypothetical protein